MIDPKNVLFIEPSATISDTPVIDELTRKMTSALRKCTQGMSFRGIHRCACGATSGNTELFLPNGLETNSLCIHYLAYHRDEVPPTELEKVRHLTCGEAEPTPEELCFPMTERPKTTVYRGA
jgi:hypothetical protein